MRKLIVFFIAVVAATVVWQRFFASPTPTERRIKAQRTAPGVVDYWLVAIMEKREFDMVSVSHDAARLQAKVAIDTLRREEERLRTICNGTSNSPMSEPGKFRATLSSDKGTLMNLTLRAGERDGKYWIFEVVQE